MARRLLQQKGDLYQQGGWWKLRWRHDTVDKFGRLKRTWAHAVTIGPCDGALGLTEKKAQRIARDNFLSRLDQNNRTPALVMTLAEFVQAKFMIGHVKHLKRSGQIHYQQMLTNHILPVIGTVRMRDMRREHVQQLIDMKADLGLSWQTLKHIRNAVSAVFTFAAQEDCHTGLNPAKHVRMGEKTVVRETNALTVEQLNDVLMLLDTPYKDMALVAVMASLHVAEICGLRWKRLNLSDKWGTSDGEALPPWTLLVCEQFYRGKHGSLKSKARRRVVPIPTMLRPLISNLRVRGHHTGPDDPVFSSRKGTPVDEHNIARRHLTLIGKKLGYHLSWHVFRRTPSRWPRNLACPFSTGWPQQVTQTPVRRSCTRRNPSTAGSSNSTGWGPKSPSNEAVEHPVEHSFVHPMDIGFS